jgi:hypothetical protein
MEKKPYSVPTVTDLGDAVEETKGITGGYWEPFGTAYGPPPPPDDPPGGLD